MLPSESSTAPIALAPSYSCAHEDRSIFLAFRGRRAEALTEIAKINQLDAGPSAATAESWTYYELRDYPNLVEAGRRGLACRPERLVSTLPSRDWLRGCG